MTDLLTEYQPMPGTTGATMATIDGDFEHHRLPSGQEVYYRTTDHWYCRGIKPGKAKGGVPIITGTGRLTGVSTVVKPFDWEPDQLMHWASKLTVANVAKLAEEAIIAHAAGRDDALDWLQDGEQIMGRLTAERLRWSDKRDERGKEGTNVHEYVLHELALGRDPKLDRLTDDERGMATGIIRFWLDHDPEVIAAEQVVMVDGAPDLDEPLGVAGRLDLIARCTSSLRGTVHIDAKTSGFISKAHHVQAAGYEVGAVEAQLVENIDASYLLNVNTAGEYFLLPVCATADDFLQAVKVYRAAGRVNREANATRKAIMESAA